MKIISLLDAVANIARPDKTGGPLLVSLSGYEPLQVKIHNMILAGERLQASRSVMYDFPMGHDPDDDFEDPTRSPGYDMADAFQDSLAAEASLKAASTLQKPVEDSQTAPAGETPPAGSEGGVAI